MVLLGMKVSVVNASANYTEYMKAQELYEKLSFAAKESENRRFHALYDKIYRYDILHQAWEKVKSNRGAPGIDEVSILDVLIYGEDRFIREIMEVLYDSHDYHPMTIRRAFARKDNGEQRPLGIPVLRDRTIETAAKMILDPIFEADFLNCSYGFITGKSTHAALEQIRLWTNRRYRFVLDADITKYFDNIDHEKLMSFLKWRISDKRVLKTIYKWLKCGIMQKDGTIDPNDIGSPQGSPISPLLSNIYLHMFDLFWTKQTKVKGKLIRYCDDFVILFSSRRDAELGRKMVEARLAMLGLELNKDKTNIVDLKGGKEGFDFLGFHHRRRISHRYGKWYTLKYPKKSAVKKLKEKIRRKIGSRSILNLSLAEVVILINPLLRGWMNYFKYGNSSKVFHAIDSYVQERLALWWSKKHQKTGRRWTTDFTYEKYKESGVVIMTGNVRYWSQTPNAH